MINKINAPRKQQAHRKEKGSALIVALFSLLLASLIGLALTFNGIYEVKVSRNYNTSTEAFYIAEAGVNHAVRVIVDNNLDFSTVLKGADGISGTSDDGILEGSYVPSGSDIPASGKTCGNGTYKVMITDGSGGAATKLVVTATGDGPNNSQNKIEAILSRSSGSGDGSSASSPNIPVPGYNSAPAALGYLGNLDKKGQLDLHIKVPHDNENDDDGSTTGNQIAIKGRDSAPGVPGVPGVVIEDSVTYDKITEKIGKKLYDGKIPANAITGSPMVTIGKPPKTGTASFANTSNPVLASAAMNQIADDVKNVVETQFIPAAGTTYSGTQVNINTATTWGSSSAYVTYVSANTLNVQSGGTITGQGKLVVSGDLRLKEGSSLNWTGDIFILGGGGNKDSYLRNERGNLTVNGNIYILGTGSGNGKSTFKLQDDNDTDVATTTVNGSVLILTGNATDNEEKAEFKAKNGQVTINGLVSIVGDKTKLDVHMKDSASFKIVGATALAVHDDGGNKKAKVHLHGNDILLEYNEQNINVAVEKLNQSKDLNNNPILDPLTIGSTSVISWREIRN